MTGGKRVYRSELRTEQARRTRATVVEAAARCFARDGYAATTMKQIAAEAGVAVQTVFAQGSKASLLMACVDVAVAGDHEEVALAEREPFVRLLEATTRAKSLEAWRDLTRRYAGRVVPAMKVFADAAGGDPEIAAAFADYETRRFTDMRVAVAALEPWLRDGLEVDRATEILWAVLDHNTGDNLLRVRGWSVEEYAEQVADVVDHLLLRPGRR